MLATPTVTYRRWVFRLWSARVLFVIFDDAASGSSSVTRNSGPFWRRSYSCFSAAIVCFNPICHYLSSNGDNYPNQPLRHRLQFRDFRMFPPRAGLLLFFCPISRRKQERWRIIVFAHLHEDYRRWKNASFVRLDQGKACCCCCCCFVPTKAGAKGLKGWATLVPPACVPSIDSTKAPRFTNFEPRNPRPAAKVQLLHKQSGNCKPGRNARCDFVFHADQGRHRHSSPCKPKKAKRASQICRQYSFTLCAPFNVRAPLLCANLTVAEVVML